MLKDESDNFNSIVTRLSISVVNDRFILKHIFTLESMYLLSRIAESMLFAVNSRNVVLWLRDYIFSPRMRDIHVLHFAIDLVIEDPRGKIIEVNTSNIF